MDMEYLNGRMEVNIVVNLNKIKFRVKETLYGVIKVYTKVNGRIIL
jgi:hypothetical protein